MNLVSGGLIEIQDYNEIALEINRLFSDNTVDLEWATSDLILQYTVTGSALGSGTPIPMDVSGLDLIALEFLVVSINEGTGWYTINNSQYTVNIVPNPEQISFNSTYGIGTQIRIHKRTDHRYGWGQQASVYPVDVGDPVLSDETTLQAYLEANINNLIDKVNVIEERIDGPSELTRINPGQLIYASDKTTITSTLQTDLAGTNYWKNEVATLDVNVHDFSRDDPWTTTLTATARYTWDSYDEFRYFFNTGSDLRATLVSSGDTGSQGFINWTAVINKMGSLILNFDRCTQTGFGGVTENIGAYKLTEDYQIVFTSAGPTAPVGVNPDEYLPDIDEYNNFIENMKIVWRARIVPDTPSAGNIAIDIRADLDDTEFAQTFDGTIEYQAGYKSADDVTDNTVEFSITDFLPEITTLDDFVIDGLAPTAGTEVAVINNGVFTNGQNIGGTFTLDGGNVITTFTSTILGNGGQVLYSNNTPIFVDTGEPYNTDETIEITGNGSGQTARMRISFGPDSGISVKSEVANVSFRIAAIDNNSTTTDEKIVVEAFNAAGDSVPVNLSGGASLSISGNEVTATSSGAPGLSDRSLLVQVVGPVARIEYTYSNDGTGSHTIYQSDVEYDFLPI